ncbi:MAG: hypothetical protein LBC77_00740, partial [Spirochaetaceae bacterium]|nr:hypothetical protein [Spirochaetaceae bacterium]
IGSKEGTTQVVIDQCYSSSAISINNSAAASAYFTGAGGLVGLIWREAGGTTSVTLSNRAAIGENALLSTPPGSAHSNKRIAGVARSDETDGFPTGTWAPNTLTLTNNIARKGMLLGTPPSGTPDNSNSDTTGATADGKAVETDALKTAAAWTALGWSETDWDFSGLPQGKWPTLK